MKDYYTSFNEYLKKRRMFIALEPSEESLEEIRKYSVNYGLQNGLDHSGEKIPQESFSYHITIWYSATGYVNPAILKTSPIEVDVSEFGILGKDDNQHLVMKIRMNETLGRIRSEYQKYGMSDEWPKFIPHMTLCYHWNKNLPRIPPIKKLTFDRLIIEETISGLF